MKPAGVPVLLFAASLLISAGDCEICSAVQEDVTVFLKGTPDEYVKQVAQYRNETEFLENARSLKECVDGKFTEDDRTNAFNVLNKIYSSPAC